MEVCDIVYSVDTFDCVLFASLLSVFHALGQFCTVHFHIINFGSPERVVVPHDIHAQVYQLDMLPVANAHTGNLFLPWVIPHQRKKALYLDTNTLMDPKLVTNIFDFPLKNSTIAIGCKGGCFLANLRRWQENNWTERLFAITFDPNAIPPGRLRGHIRREALEVIASNDDAMISLETRGVYQYETNSRDNAKALRLMQDLPLNLGVPGSMCFSQHRKGELQHVSVSMVIVIMVVLCVLYQLVGLFSGLLLGFLRLTCLYSAYSRISEKS